METVEAQSSKFDGHGIPGQLSRSDEPKIFPSAKPISPPTSPIDKTSARQSSASRRSIEPGYLNTLKAMNSTPPKTPRVKPRRLNFCSNRRSGTKGIQSQFPFSAQGSTSTKRGAEFRTWSEATASLSRKYAVGSAPYLHPLPAPRG